MHPAKSVKCPRASCRAPDASKRGLQEPCIGCRYVVQSMYKDAVEHADWWGTAGRGNDMKDDLRKWTSNLAVAALVTVGAGDALALPKEGEKVPNARVEDAEGRALEMKSLKGKPVLVVYEDKDSAQQNQTLKEELSKLAKGDKYKSAIALTAIADVSAYDFWPAKGFVKDAIREESKKAGTTIYCDWSGGFRTTWKLREGMSNVLLIGKDGRVLFAAEGILGAEERKRLLGLLRGQIEGGA